MSRILHLIVFLSLSFGLSYAQTIKICFKDGDIKVFELSQIDSIVCFNDKIENEITDITISDSNLSENDILGYINSLYLNLIKFETGQLYLEAQRTGKINAEDFYAYEDISPNCSTIKDTWTAGFATITRCNGLLSILSDSNQSYASSYSKEVRILRAFVYYNMTQLWGDVPLIVESSIDPTASIGRSEQSKVLAFICNELKEIIDNTSVNELNDDSFRFNLESAKMLLAESDMLSGNKVSANQILNSLTDYSPIFEFNLNNVSDEYINWGYRNYMKETNSVVIYTTSMADLFKQENDGYMDGLENSWNNYCSSYQSQYGYWAALKRIGKAKEITGCQSYMLLMPIPYTEIMMNPCMTQNPGWGTR